MSVSIDVLHERGRQALLRGEPVLDSPPGEGSRRWGVSVLLRPQPDLADGLHELTLELAALAGPGQWTTGARDSSHLTLYSLEPHRLGVHAADPLVRRYAEATRTTARACGPVTFELTGLALTPGGVVAACTPVDDGARRLRPSLLDALGGEAFEASYRGDQWWMSLLHLAAPVRRPADLVEYVHDRRVLGAGRLHADRLELVRYEYRRDPGRVGMVPVPLDTASLAGAQQEVTDGSNA